MAYTLGNKCAKNIRKRIVLLQLIIKNVVTFFLEHSVDILNWHSTDMCMGQEDKEDPRKDRLTW